MTISRLAETVARIFARPLDRNRPLWEIYLIQGLSGGRVALLTKIHHSVVDGVSGNEILSVLLDSHPEGREIPPPHDAGAPRPRPERPGDGRPRHAGRVQAAAACGALAPRRTLPHLTELPASPRCPAGRP